MLYLSNVFPEAFQVILKGTVSSLRSTTYSFVTIVKLVYSVNIHLLLMGEMKIFIPMMLIFESN